VAGGWLAADGHLLLDGGKSEHFDLDIPDAGREIHCVPAGIVAVCDYFGTA
jgi:hypothetical protein